MLTGGAGFIGSHIAVEVARTGYRPVILDNLCNSKASVIDRLARIIRAPVHFIHGDIRDGEKVLRVLHWAFQQRGQEWASLIMVRDASSGRLRRGLTEVMAMLEDSGELQVQWFRTNEALGDLAAYTIPHGARQHGLLRAIELYLEFRDEASRIRRFDFKHHFAYRTRMFALTLDYASGSISIYAWRWKQPPLNVRQRGVTTFRGLRIKCAKANPPPGACQCHAVACSVSSRSSSPC